MKATIKGWMVEGSPQEFKELLRGWTVQEVVDLTNTAQKSKKRRKYKESAERRFARWTDAERRRVYKMRLQGMSFPAIAKETGRTKKAVYIAYKSFKG